MNVTNYKIVKAINEGVHNQFHMQERWFITHADGPRIGCVTECLYGYDTEEKAKRRIRDLKRKDLQPGHNIPLPPVIDAVNAERSSPRGGRVSIYVMDKMDYIRDECHIKGAIIADGDSDHSDDAHNSKLEQSMTEDAEMNKPEDAFGIAHDVPDTVVITANTINGESIVLPVGRIHHPAFINSGGYYPHQAAIDALRSIRWHGRPRNGYRPAHRANRFRSAR